MGSSSSVAFALTFFKKIVCWNKRIKFIWLRQKQCHCVHKVIAQMQFCHLAVCQPAFAVVWCGCLNEFQWRCPKSADESKSPTPMWLAEHCDELCVNKKHVPGASCDWSFIVVVFWQLSKTSFAVSNTRDWPSFIHSFFFPSHPPVSRVAKFLLPLLAKRSDSNNIFCADAIALWKRPSWLCRYPSLFSFCHVLLLLLNQCTQYQARGRVSTLYERTRAQLALLCLSIILSFMYLLSFRYRHQLFEVRTTQTRNEEENETQQRNSDAKSLSS